VALALWSTALEPHVAACFWNLLAGLDGVFVANCLHLAQPLAIVLFVLKECARRAYPDFACVDSLTEPHSVCQSGTYFAWGILGEG
jgi:hypothetical protein